MTRHLLNMLALSSAVRSMLNASPPSGAVCYEQVDAREALLLVVEFQVAPFSTITHRVNALLTYHDMAAAWRDVIALAKAHAGES